MSEENLSDEGEGIKGLRTQYEKQGKDLQSALERLSKFEAAERQSSVATVLKAKGVSASAAKLYTSEDTSEEAVGKWLEDFADVFPVQSAGADDANAKNVQRVSDASHGVVNSIQNGPTGQKVYGDPEEIAHAIATLPYEELVKLDLMPPRGTIFNPDR